MIPETLMLPLTAGALGIALVQLRSAMLGKALPGCGPQSSCEELTSGRWSRVGPVPVAALGTAVYFAFLVSAVLTHPQFPVELNPDRLSNSLMFCAVISAGAAVWFTALQALVIRKFCVYCTLGHLAAFMASVMAFVRMKPAESVFFTGVGVLMAFIFGQILFPPKLFSSTGAQNIAPKTIEEGEPVKAKAIEEEVKPQAPAGTEETVSPPPLPLPETAVETASEAREEAPVSAEAVEEVVEETVLVSPIETPLSIESASENETPAEPAREPSVFDFVTGAMEDAVEAMTQKPEETPPAIEMEAVKVEEAIEQEAPRRLAVLEGKISLSVRLWPMLGKSTAKRMAVDLMDFTCKHCRTMHALLKALVEENPEEWAVLIMPVPMDVQCNPTMKSTPKEHEGSCEYTRLALAVFHVAPKAFGAFEEWLCEGETAPALEEVRAKAAEILGEAGLKWALEDPRQAKRLNEAIAIYDAVGQGQIPKLLLEKQLISGPVLTRGQLEEIVEKELDLLANG